MNTTDKKPVSFAVTRDETILICKIMDRGMKMAEEAGRRDMTRDRMSVHMDITACIANGCPMRLQEWLDADDFNFAHDFFGIHRHLDRETGQLTDCFLPRFNGKNKA